MPLRKWDAYRSLNITSRDSHTMTCVGMNKYGKRCRWGIDSAFYHDIRAILDAMEERPPNEAFESLEELAGLSLCRDYHRNQANQVVHQWESAIMEVAEEYEDGMRLGRSIHVLEENLAREEARTDELRREVEELRAQVRNQAGLRELQGEVERLRVQLANEQAESTSATNQWRTTLQTYEDQELRTEEYRRALIESERKVENLEEEKKEISCQLDAEKEALELATRRCEEYTATSSQLVNELSIRSTDYQQSLSEKAQTIERITAEQGNLLAEIATLKSQLSQLNEQSIQMSQEINRATTEQINLTMQVENLTRELDLELQTSSKYQSDFLQTRAHRDTLSKRVDDLRSQLDNEQQRSHELLLDLQDAETTRTTLSNEKIVVQSQLESEHQKYEELTAELSRLKTDQTTLSIETETLRIKVASEHKISTQLHQELSTTKEDLSTTKLALEGAQTSLENYQRGNDELKTSAAEKEKETSALIAALTDQIDFFKTHPFKTLFMSLIDIFKRRATAVIRYMGSVRSSKRILGTNDPEVNFSA